MTTINLQKMHPFICRKMDRGDRGNPKRVESKAPESVIRYAEFIKKTKPGVRKIYLFGSYAKGTWNADSDIDLAIVFDDVADEFDIQVELMKLRRRFDTRIEPHPFTVSDFNANHPLASEVIRYGIEIS